MSIKSIQNENGNIVGYRIRVVARDSKLNRKATICKTKVVECADRNKAEKEEKILLRLAHAELTQRFAMGPTWESVLDAWELAIRDGSQAYPRIGMSTLSQYISIARKYSHEIRNRPARSIQKIDVQGVLSEQTELGKSLSRLKAIRQAFALPFEWGQQRGLIDRNVMNPCYGLKIEKRAAEKEPEVLTKEQISRFLEEAKNAEHEWYPVWTVALLTGMRSGELYALEWKDVNFENRLINVNKSYSWRMKQAGPTKGKRWRNVPINAELLSFLRDLKGTATSIYVLPRLNYWKRSEAAKVLRQFLVSIGLPSVRFHTLRACFATQLLRQGLAQTKVMKICGWQDLDTMQRYLRLSAVEIEGATEGLSFLG